MSVYPSRGNLECVPTYELLGSHHFHLLARQFGPPVQQWVVLSGTIHYLGQVISELMGRALDLCGEAPPSGAVGPVTGARHM